MRNRIQRAYNIAELRKLAKRRLPAPMFHYIDGGGIRRGVHILKAMALGATACSAGRPYLYGLGAGGEAGASRALKILRAELERDMALIGAAKLSDVTEQLLRPVGGRWPA